jgi:hypothetical protein
MAVITCGKLLFRETLRARETADELVTVVRINIIILILQIG